MFLLDCVCAIPKRNFSRCTMSKHPVHSLALLPLCGHVTGFFLQESRNFPIKNPVTYMVRGLLFRGRGVPRGLICILHRHSGSNKPLRHLCFTSLLMARRVTLVVVFAFVRRWGPTNVTLSFYECRLSDGDTSRWWGHSKSTCCN